MAGPAWERRRWGWGILVLPALLLAAACREKPAAAVHQGPVVLVTFDSLRADTVSGMGGLPGLTPNLERLAGQAAWAGRAVASSSWEVPAMASLWTGLRPWQHQSIHAGQAHLADDLLTLPEALKAARYTTAGFTGGRWYSGALGYDQGFDSLQDFGRGREALARLKNLSSGRQFIWIHLPEPRAPYVRRDWLVPRLGAGMAEYLAPLPRRVELRDLEPYFDPLVPLPLGRRRFFFSMYRLNVAWADERFGRLLEALQASGRYDDTLLVVTANHGEEFGENEQVLHGGNLGRPLLEVPLIVKLPAGFRRPLALEAGHEVAAARIWATIVEAVGGTPAPAVAPSLFRHDADGVVSELYLANGENQFSLVEGGLRLLLRARFSDPLPGYYEARLTSLRHRRREAQGAAQGGDTESGAFGATLPLSGRGRSELRLERWEPGATVTVDDPGRAARAARRLHDLWARFLPRELPPEEEVREWPAAAREAWERGRSPAAAPAEPAARTDRPGTEER